MIGIFDSGSGGLTVLKAIRNEMPSADILYFGDIKNAPYGEREHDELFHLTVNAFQLLKERGVTKIVSACNSVSASLAVSLFDAFSLSPSDLIEMVGPTVSFFRNSSARILLVATPATIQSGIYQDAFKMIGKEITAIPIPGLAGLIEFGKPIADIEDSIKKALASVALNDFDVLILGCTHYPLVHSLFTGLIPSSLTVFDPAFAVAERVKHTWWPQEVGTGTIHFMISKESERFREFVHELFPGTTFTVEVLP